MAGHCCKLPSSCELFKLLRSYPHSPSPRALPSPATPKHPQDIREKLCGDPKAGGAALLTALKAGGKSAQAATQAILEGGDCGDTGDGTGSISASVTEFGNAREMNDPGRVLE